MKSIIFKADKGHVRYGEIVGQRKSRSGKTILSAQTNTMWGPNGEIVPYIMDVHPSAILTKKQAREQAIKRSRSCNCDGCKRIRHECAEPIQIKTYQSDLLGKVTVPEC